MSAFEVTRIDALSRELDLSPQQLLVAALQLARANADTADIDQRGRDSIAAVRAAPRESEVVAALLLTPIMSFALDDIDRALAMLWLAPVHKEH